MGAHQVLTLSRGRLAADVLMAAGGTILVVLALAALALFAMRRRAGDPSLVSFAIFSLLYAMRLFASTWTVPTLLGGPDWMWVYARDIVTYVINIPLVIFTEQVLGPGWRNFRRWLIYVVVAFAIVAVAGAIVTERPEWALDANHWLVLGFLPAIVVAFVEQRHRRTRPTQWIIIGGIIATVFVVAENLHSLNVMTWWPGDIEFIGFIAFTVSLAFAVTERFLTDEARLAAVDRELETARRIQQSILPRDVPGVEGLRVTARYLPMTAVAGDFYDFFASADGGAAGVLVADVSGHGVPAALIASMFKVAASSHRDDVSSPGRLLTLMNRTLDGQLGGQFVTAICVYLDRRAGLATFAGAGHPPILLWQASTRELVTLSSTGVILGPFPTAEYGTGQHTIASGDRLLLYTDGLVEATEANGSGRMFGDQRFPTLLREYGSQPGAALADIILTELARWSGKSTSFDDDVTLVIVEVM
jgi:sigma-B regulation protein RsbU (phosphoserine phosphatase)